MHSGKKLAKPVAGLEYIVCENLSILKIYLSNGNDIFHRKKMYTNQHLRNRAAATGHVGMNVLILVIPYLDKP